jgi:hypothetical protein
MQRSVQSRAQLADVTRRRIQRHGDVGSPQQLHWSERLRVKHIAHDPLRK